MWFGGLCSLCWVMWIQQTAGSASTAAVSAGPANANGIPSYYYYTPMLGPGGFF
jgi:hypothetical protein